MGTRTAEGGRGLARGARHPALGLLLLLVLQGAVVHYQPTFHPANEAIRFYFVESVVQDGTLSIDPSLARWRIGNIDAAERDGRRYMDKAPGLAFGAVPVYAALRATGVADALPWTLLWHLVTLLCVTLPSLLATALLYRLALDLSGRRDAALVVAAAYALGTPAFLYGTLFFGHQPAAVLLLAGFAVLRPAEQAPVSAPRAALAGFLLAFAVVTEYQAVVAAAVLAVFGLVRAGTLRRRAWLVTGGLVPTALLLAYHAAAFGGPFAFPYAFKAHAEFAAVHGQGVFGFALPSAERAFELLVGPRRGLLYQAPVLALAPLGLLRMWSAPSWSGARWAVLGVGLLHTVLVLGYLYWTGGDAVGPRFLVPALPFLALPLAALWRPGRAEPVFAGARALVPGLAATGAILGLTAHLTFPYHPEALPHPFWDLSAPLLLSGCTSPLVGGLRGPLALAAVGALLVAGAAWLAFATRRPGSGPTRQGALRLAASVALTALLLALQVTLAPAPDRPEARAVQRYVGESLLQCQPGS